MHRFLLRPLSAVVVASAAFGASFALGGCSSSDSGAQSQSDFIAKYCAEFTPCCAKAGRPTDGATCRAFVSAFAPQGGFNVNAANACLGEVHAASSRADFCDNLGGGSVPSCDKVFAKGGGGSVAPGGTCTKSSDCASSTEGKVDCASSFSGGSTTRKCQVQVVGKAGDSPCVGTVSGNTTSYSGSSSSTDIPSKGYLCNVKDGVYCSSTGACTAISPVGGDCSGSSFGYECVPEAFCDFTTKKCVARKATGEPCDTFGESCVPADYCESTSKTCEPKVADGAACSDSQSCASGNCVNKKCEKNGLSDFGLAFVCGGG